MHPVSELRRPGHTDNIANNVLTAVHTVKQMNDEGYFEPVLNCRHHLPPGWFF
jgi:hypothetical protein